MRQIKYSRASFLLFIGLTGCATIMTGTNQEVSFNSNPPGATVIVNGRTIGITPVSTALKKEGEQPMTFKKDGYQDLTLQLESRTTSWFWGNIVIGGFFGSTTDAASGAMNEYSPGQYLVTLQPNGSSPSPVERSTNLTEQQKVRDFIIAGYRPLMEDLSKGSGQYLKSLLVLLHVQAAEKDGAIKKINALSEVYTNIPDFADRVIDFYLPKAG
jgi:hypothetical protein